MITRNKLFKSFCSENDNQPYNTLMAVFKSTTDEQLAELYGLRILRKGYFY